VDSMFSVIRTTSKYLNAMRYPMMRHFCTTTATTPTQNKKKIKKPRKLGNVAVVLSGCGVYDGSEITETVSFFIALSSIRATFQCYAPNQNQTDVIDHVTGQSSTDKRNAMTEAARIARGKVKDIKELDVKNYDGIVFPGGFGVAKNLSNFGEKGPDFTVNPEIERILKSFHENKKPIGMACISPILAAKVFGTKSGGPGCTITLGKTGAGWPYEGTIAVAEKFGIKHMLKQNGVVEDKRNLIFTTPAFMRETSDFSKVFLGIDALVKAMRANLHKKIKKESLKEPRKKIMMVILQMSKFIKSG